MPGTMIGPGLIFGATPHTLISDDSGPKLALSAATGDAAADEKDGGTGETFAYTVHDVRTGTRLTRLAPRWARAHPNRGSAFRDRPDRRRCSPLAD